MGSTVGIIANELVVVDDRRWPGIVQTLGRTTFWKRVVRGIIPLFSIVFTCP